MSLRARYRRWRARRASVCSFCGGTGQALSYRGRFAALIACPVCSDGRKLADTMIPSVTTRR